MTIAIDWPVTKIISIQKVDMVEVSPTEFELDVDAFHITLRDLEASEPGAPWATTHTHNTEVTLGGITFARLIEIVGGYTITFEDGSYAVTLLGANNNILDVANLNSVSIRSTNSAGLIVTDASGLTSAESSALILIEQILRNKIVTDPVTGVMTLSDDIGAILLTADIFEDVAGTVPYRGKGVERKERLT